MNIFKQVVWRLKESIDTPPTFSDVPMGGVFRKQLGGCVYIKTTTFSLNDGYMNCILLSAAKGDATAGYAYRTEPDNTVFPATVEITA